MEANNIREAFNELMEARTALHQYIEEDLAARDKLKRKEAQLLATPGAIIGKNAETRDAQLREACSMEVHEVECAREAKAEAQLRMDLAVMAVDEIKTLIRNDEAIARIGAVG